MKFFMRTILHYLLKSTRQYIGFLQHSNIALGYGTHPKVSPTSLHLTQSIAKIGGLSGNRCNYVELSLVMGIAARRLPAGYTAGLPAVGTLRRGITHPLPRPMTSLETPIWIATFWSYLPPLPGQTTKFRKCWVLRISFSVVRTLTSVVEKQLWAVYLSLNFK